MAYENVKYSKDYLQEVVVRVDFLSPLEKNKNKVMSKLNREIIKIFSIPETKELVNNLLSVNVINGKPKQECKSEKYNDFHYSSQDGQRLLTLNKYSLSISHFKYGLFETFKSEFIQIMQELFKYEEVQIKRMGLRYINNINIDEPEPTNWKTYIDNNLISVFEFYNEPKYISRAFNIIELMYEQFKLRFQYGMYNPDYPAPIAQKLFVLDYDAYHEGLIENMTEIQDTLELFHNEIQKLFEKSITTELRNKMR